MTITGSARAGSVLVAEAEPEREEWVFREAKVQARAGSAEDHPAPRGLLARRPARSIARQAGPFAAIGDAGRRMAFDALGCAH
jgi:hypothetical protein